MKKIPFILITILLSSCTIISTEDCVVESVSKGVSKKYRLEIYAFPINTYLMTDSLFNPGDTIKFSK